MPGYKELFARYPNRIFIETGSYTGDGIQAALDAGFEPVYSIELSAQLFSYCCRRFEHNDKVLLSHGDSGEMLSRILEYIDEPVTFWLDSHYSEGATVMGKKETPLLEELEAISKHHIKTHTILIDDLRCWNKEVHGFDARELVRIITAINPDYCFSQEDGIDSKFNVYRNDILVAQCLRNQPGIS